MKTETETETAPRLHEMPAGDVLVAYSAPEAHSTLFAQSLVSTLLSDRDTRLIVDVVSCISSPRIAATRNMLVEAFLAHPARPSWLLMLDADMTFSAEQIASLIAIAHPVDRPFVSGLYFGGRIDGKITPHAYLLDGRGAFNPIEGVTAAGEWGPVIRVHGVGAGCMLLHRAMLEAVGRKHADSGFPWFVESTNGAGEQVGEDLAFCARAHALGYPIHVATGVILGHHKHGIIDERSFCDYLAKRDMHGGGVCGDEWVVKDQLSRLRTNGQVCP